MKVEVDDWDIVMWMFIVGTITTSCLFGYGVACLLQWAFP